MFVAFLPPYPFRGLSAPYLWCYYRLLEEWKDTPSMFILGKDYVKPYFTWKNRWEISPEMGLRLGYRLPIDIMPSIHHFEWLKEERYDVWLKQSKNNSLNCFKSFLTERDYEYEREIETLLNKAPNEITAVFTICNIPSLKAVCKKKNIPLIHYELGPLRGPMYFETGYIDFSGVNGNTECYERYIKNKGINDKYLTTKQLLTLFLTKEKFIPNKQVGNNNIGVILQVENDSNTIAFGNGMNNLSLIYAATNYKNSDDNHFNKLIIRDHPGSYFSLRSNNHFIDSSENSLEFVAKCDTLFTINSSVAIEALLMNKRVVHFGDNAYNFIIEESNEAEKVKRLNFYLLNYLVPFSLQVKPEYIRFRLSNPSENQIRDCHMQEYLNKKLKYLNEEIECLNKEVSALELGIKQKEEQLQGIINSRSWKLTKPLRSATDILRKYQSTLKNKQIKQLSPKDNVVILTTIHCLYLANLIKNSLQKIRINTEIITSPPKRGFKKSLHIVICPQMFSQLPSRYIAYQMEQSISSRWFTKDYINTLSKSIAIFDYSLCNIKYLREEGIPLSKLYYLPVGYINSNHQHHTDETYDVLFYGDTNTPRRQEYLDEIKKNFSIKIINDLFGDDLYQEMKKAKVIVNIHYYENALLETTRIYECLSQNCIIISEEGSDMDEYDHLSTLVDFVPINDISSMIARIAFWVNNEEKRINYKRTLPDKCHEAPDFFTYFLYRGLLANDLIDYNDFYKICSSIIKLDGNKICLSLPETPERKNSFEQDNKYKFSLFPGLKHQIGWIGCGLSYKFLIQLAKDSKMKNITICEDDVLFPDDFSHRYNKISMYLNNTQDNWDIFSGLIADIDQNTHIVDIKNIDNEDYITINKMVSMVLNIYSESSFQKIIEWDHTNQDSNKNTIDRFLENTGNLVIVTTTKFLVGHKEDLNSTLWGFNNLSYSYMIYESEEKLKELVRIYKNSHI